MENLLKAVSIKAFMEADFLLFLRSHLQRGRTLCTGMDSIQHFVYAQLCTELPNRIYTSKVRY